MIYRISEQVAAMTRLELIAEIDWSQLKPEEIEYAQRTWSDQDLMKQLEDQRHAKDCGLIQCHHDLWAFPPHKYGHGNCRCLECMENS